MRGIKLGLVVLAASTSIFTPVSAETVKLKAILNAASEVPPNDSTGKGSADVSYDTTSKTLSWKVTYSDLTGPATAAHFHGPAEPGKNAPVVIPFKDASSGAEGSATLTDEQAADLLGGKFYINVHTAAHKGGEIRAQVVK